MIFRENCYYRLQSYTSAMRCDLERKRFYPLSRGDIVLCVGFSTSGKLKMKSVGHARERYAILRFQNDDGEMVLYYRVSSLNRGNAFWSEVDPMTVIAMSDRLPL